VVGLGVYLGRGRELFGLIKGFLHKFFRIGGKFTKKEVKPIRIYTILEVG